MKVRYPLEPLAIRLDAELGVQGGRHPATDGPTGLTAVCEALHVSESSAKRYRRFGLSDRQADHAATVLGMHPSQVWPEWFDAVPGDADLELVEVWR